jgi:transposase
LTSKIHVVVDAVGRLIHGSLTAGNTHDVTQAQALLQGLPAKWVVADKGYDANHVIEAVEQAGARAVIPPRSNRRHQRRYSKQRYKHRNLVERFFCRIKQFRRIATRYDKLAERFVSFVCLASAMICLS